MFKEVIAKALSCDISPLIYRRSVILPNITSDASGAPCIFYSKTPSTRVVPCCSLKNAMEERLIESLQVITLHQARTIEMLSETIAQLQEAIAEALTTPAEAAIGTSAHDLQATQKELEVTRQKLKQICSIFAESSFDSVYDSISIAFETSDGSSKPYQRAVRIWELTQQWNQRCNYDSARAVWLSQSILIRKFGIHVRAIRQFMDDYADEIQAENERLGIAQQTLSFNKGDKLEHFVSYTRSALESLESQFS